jgi:hypothetical protein
LFFVLCSSTVLIAKEAHNYPRASLVVKFIKTNTTDPSVDLLYSDCEFQQLAKAFFSKLKQKGASLNRSDIQLLQSDMWLRMEVIIPDIQDRESKMFVLHQVLIRYLKENNNRASIKQMTPYCLELYVRCTGWGIDREGCLWLYIACEVASSPN